MSIDDDVVIVGGGSAGCALAGRLSEDPGIKVRLLEAGGPHQWWDLLVRMPMAMPRVVGDPNHDWNFLSEPEPGLNGRRLVHPRGKRVGGSSSINGGVYQRGNRADFDGWARELNAPQWDYAHCLPYFRRTEIAHGGRRLAADGKPTLDRGEAAGPLFGAFLAASQQAGYPLLNDEASDGQDGFGPLDRAVRHGRRVTSADAYLVPARNRPNLRVEANSPLSAVIFEGNRAVGVRYRPGGGPEQEIRAGEVILAGGTMNSPQMLQLSGVGDGADLSELGIPVVSHLPGVGRSAQEHLGICIQHACTQPVSAVAFRKRWRWPGIGMRWLIAGTGPGASTQIEAGGFVRTSPDKTYPDLQLAFAPLVWATDGLEEVGGHGYQLYLMIGCVQSRGKIGLRSADPADHPTLFFNFLGEEPDREFWPRALRIGRELLAQSAFRDFDGGELTPGPAVATDAQLLEWVRQEARTGVHPTSSCRMGHDDLAVVDPATLKVHGLEGIRVVDASVMPWVPNANTYAPTMMIAEKAADLILGNTPLPPSVQISDSQPA